MKRLLQGLSTRSKRSLKGGLVAIMVYSSFVLLGSLNNFNSWILLLLVSGPGSVLNLYGRFYDREHLTVAGIPIQIHLINLLYYFLAGAFPRFLFRQTWIAAVIWLLAALMAGAIGWLTIVLMGFTNPGRGI